MRKPDFGIVDNNSHYGYFCHFCIGCIRCKDRRRCKDLWETFGTSSWHGCWCNVGFTVRAKQCRFVGCHGGTAAAVPPPFRPGNPALCGSRPLVTPYYCRLGDLLCYNCMLYLSTILCVHAYVCNSCFLCVFVLFSFTAFSFSTLILLVGSFDL